MRMSPRSDCLSMSSMPRIRPVDVHHLRLSCVAAAEGEQLLGEPAPRSTRLHGVVDQARATLLRGTPEESRLPSTAVSRLLKSWAMPPVSRPIASIFCAWNRPRGPAPALAARSAAR